MPTSGSFVRGNYAGRFTTGVVAIRERMQDSSSFYPFVFNKERMQDVSAVGYTSASLLIGRRGSYGFMQGVTFSTDNTTMDGRGSDGVGRHMQTGVNKNTTDGSPSAPSLQLDTPGFWRFRWVIKGSTRTISVSTKQNSTGSSLRPSMVIRSNPSIGVNYDISGSAADGSGWTLIGPLSVTPTGTGSVWVELHNNNTYYSTMGNQGGVSTTPALFDHIQTT